MTQEYQISPSDFENLRRLCRTFNSFIPKSRGFTPIPRGLVTLNPISSDKFFMQPELNELEAEEFPIDKLTPSEKNILLIETLMSYNLELLNDKYVKDFSSLKEEDSKNVFSANYGEYLIILISNILMMIQNILSKNIYFRLAGKNLPLNGDFFIRKDFVIASKLVDECEESPADKQTYVILTARDFEELTGQDVSLDPEKESEEIMEGDTSKTVQ